MRYIIVLDPKWLFAAKKLPHCVRLFHDLDQNENKKSFVR